MAAQLTCPLCHEQVDNLIYNFHRASEDVVINKIQSLYPEWLTEHGVCSRCVDYYHTTFLQDANLIPEIGPHFPIKTVDDYVVIPTPLRMNAQPNLTGKGVTLCMIDSGFYHHPDLIQPRNRILRTVNIAGDANSSDNVNEPLDDCWHGTMTSVVCAGNGFLSDGLYRGIASDANLVLLKVKNKQGISGDNIAKAIRWAIANKEKYNIRIINLSVADDFPVSYKESEVDRAAEDAFSAGIVIIAAVGNDVMQAVKPPANSPNVVAVGGVNDHNTLGMMNESIYHSTYGVTVDGFLKPELIAPSIWVAAPILPTTKAHRESQTLFTLLETPKHIFKNLVVKEIHNTSFDPSVIVMNSSEEIREMVKQRVADTKYISPYYQHADGTSFAAPIVCSVVAQMLEANPSLSPKAVRQILLTTARPLVHVPVERQGHGVISAPGAVQRSIEEMHSSAEDYPSSPVIDWFNQRLIFYYHNDDAKSVALVGSFNNWKPNPMVFTKNGRGVWRAEISMLPKGTHVYKFVVDKKHWIPDPENSHRENDGFNGLNSRLVIT